MLSSFYITAIDLLGILYLVVGLVDMHMAALFMWALPMFSYSSFAVYSDFSRRESNLFLIAIDFLHHDW